MVVCFFTLQIPNKKGNRFSITETCMLFFSNKGLNSFFTQIMAKIQDDILVLNKVPLLTNFKFISFIDNEVQNSCRYYRQKMAFTKSVQLLFIIVIAVALIRGTRCSPIAEKDELLSNKDKIHRNKRELNIIQDKLVSLLNPQPIIDTIKEKDKYGNIGEHPIGKKIVDAYGNVAQALGTMLTFKRETATKVSRGVTALLDQVGGKLWGISK